MSTSSSPGGARSLVLLLVALVAAAYWRAASTFFAIDDFIYLRSTWTLWASATDFFVYPRGLAESGFALHRMVFGLRPAWFHVMPFALHLANAVMVHGLIRWALPASKLTAPIASIVFALHPAAYTPMAWLSQGFETIPCLTFTLCAVHLFLRHLERPRWALLALSLVSMVLATASKNNGVLVPVYLAALGVIHVSRAGVGGERSRSAVRLALALAPFALFAAWFLTQVLGSLPHMDSPAYQRDVRPSALWQSYRVLLSHTFNVLPVFRQPVGYQLAVPEGFGTSARAVDLYHAIVASIGIAVGWAAWKRGQALFVGAMAVIVVGGLSFAAPLTRHLQDYYSYFVLPAACGLVALPLAWWLNDPWPRATGVARAASVTLLLVYAVCAGHLAHRSNHAVLQATGARAVDDFVRLGVGPEQTLIFVPPNGAANADTVAGASVSVLQAAKNLTTMFPSTREAQAVFRPDARTLLVALDDVAGRGARVYSFDLVQWGDAGAGPVLEGERRIIQRFSMRSNGLSEIQVRTSRPSKGCRMESAVYRLTTESGSSGASRVAVGGGTADCANGFFQVIPVSGQRDSAGKTYELELSAVGRSSLTLYHLSPVPAEFTRFEELGPAMGEAPVTEPKVLSFRVVVESPESRP